jgi:hypothetical protein
MTNDGATGGGGGASPPEPQPDKLDTTTATIAAVAQNGLHIIRFS